VIAILLRLSLLMDLLAKTLCSAVFPLSHSSMTLMVESVNTWERGHPARSDAGKMPAFPVLLPRKSRLPSESEREKREERGATIALLWDTQYYGIFFLWRRRKNTTQSRFGAPLRAAKMFASKCGGRVASYPLLALRSIHYIWIPRQMAYTLLKILTQERNARYPYHYFTRIVLFCRYFCASGRNSYHGSQYQGFLRVNPSPDKPPCSEKTPVIAISLKRISTSITTTGNSNAPGTFISTWVSSRNVYVPVII